jgi:hypothetical protein
MSFSAGLDGRAASPFGSEERANLAPLLGGAFFCAGAETRTVCAWVYNRAGSRFVSMHLRTSPAVCSLLGVGFAFTNPRNELAPLRRGFSMRAGSGFRHSNQRFGSCVGVSGLPPPRQAHTMDRPNLAPLCFPWWAGLFLRPRLVYASNCSRFGRPALRLPLSFGAAAYLSRRGSASRYRCLLGRFLPRLGRLLHAGGPFLSRRREQSAGNNAACGRLKDCFVINNSKERRR